MPWKTGWVERVQHLDIDEGFELLVGHHVGTTAFPLFTIIRKPLTNDVVYEVHPLVEDCQNAAAGKPIATGGGGRVLREVRIDPLDEIVNGGSST